MPVRAVVVEDEVRHFFGWKCVIQSSQETQKLLVPMAWIAFPEDWPFDDVQRCEERRRAVALVA